MSPTPAAGGSAGAPRPPGPVLVTGAGGFIGRAVRDRLRTLGVEVRGVDVAGTRAVLAAAAAAGVRRVVHLSSVVVHGYVLPAWVDEDHPVTLTGDAYVDTKIAGEQVVLAAHARDEVEVVVVRPGDVYGRGICGHVHVDNLVDALVLAVAVPGAAGHVLHVTDGVATTWEHYLTELGRLVGRRPRCLQTPVAVAVASAVGRAERARGRPSELCAASMRLLARTVSATARSR